MEKATVKALLEKYWQAETTVEEERALAAWFSDNPDADPELEPYRALFAYFDEESRISPGEDFEVRILQAITASQPLQPGEPLQPGQPLRPIRHFHGGLIAAAASVCILVIGLFLLRPEPPSPSAVVAKNAIVSTDTPAAALSVAVIKDTYNDPQQALTAIRHALLVASVHLNEGRKQITGK
ncbi:hypothetical protein [Puia dinghuensis]|uniref:Uncharacterized protein n=1 Tax=Puia dinghuensis TaxID=1792502 RepID=A0A8J2UD89_9BACT|nr:hypothetical protein [Puia dinghuensis]GGA98933.1 hypothetical protein GCM10011511_22810 [Puia dinghuensis]